MSLTIAALRSEDHDEWLTLWSGYLKFYETELADSVTESTFARMVSATPDIDGAIARDESGRAVGIVHWLTHAGTWTTTEYCYLEDLFVSADARGLGVGAALIEHVRRWAEQRGADKVYWLTAETNARARRLYDQVATRTGFIHYEVPLNDGLDVGN